MTEIFSLLITCIIFLCVIVLICTFFYIVEVNKTRKLSSVLDENRLMLHAVLEQSDVNFWECDFSNFEEEYKEIETSLLTSDAKNIAEIDEFNNEKFSEENFYNEEFSELDRFFLDEEIDELKKYLSEKPSTIKCFNSICGAINPFLIKKEYREQYLQMLKSFGQGKRGPTVEIKIPVSISDSRDNVQFESWKRLIYKTIKADASGKVLTAIALVMDITSQERNEREYENTIKYNFTQQQYPLYTRLNLTKNRIQESAFLIEDFRKGLKSQSAIQFLKFLQNLVKNSNQNQNQILNRDDLITKFREGVREVNYSFYYKFSDGELRWFDLHIKLVLNPKKDEIEANCYLLDMTNQNIALATKDDVLNEDVDYIFWLNKVTGVCQFINKDESIDWLKSVETIPYEDFMKLFLSKTISNSDKDKIRQQFSLENIAEKLLKYDEYKFSYHARKEDGSVEIKQEKIYYYQKDSNILIYVCNDVTAIALMQNENAEKLAEAIKQAELANASKSQFLSRMSHDLRTPMNGVIGLAQLAKKELEDPNALEKDINKILLSSTYMISLLNDILDMSKIESGKMQIANAPTKLGDMLENITTLAHVMCDEKGISFCSNILPTESKFYIVNIDKVHIQQIVMNLISNASKFTPTGGQIEFSLETSMLENGKLSVTLKVRDTGSGMSKEFQRIMYDAFIQDNNSVNKVGTGLGLTIVRSLVQLMDGTISCISAPGEGTEFIIKIEVDKINFSENTLIVADSSFKENYKDFDLTGKRALLVEDNELNQEIASRLLEMKGVQVEVACNGLDALNIFSEQEENYYDFVLMDVMMPVMDGLQSTKLLRGLKREDVKSIPIIAMTANAFVEDIKNCIDAGMTTHIAKPIDKEKMFETISQCLFEKENQINAKKM